MEQIVQFYSHQVQHKNGQGRGYYGSIGRASYTFGAIEGVIAFITADKSNGKAKGYSLQGSEKGECFKCQRKEQNRRNVARQFYDQLGAVKSNGTGIENKNGSIRGTANTRVTIKLLMECVPDSYMRSISLVTLIVTSSSLCPKLFCLHKPEWL